MSQHFPWSLRAVALVLSFGTATAHAADWRLAVEADEHVDGAPLGTLDRDDVWQHVQPRPGRNLAYGRAEARASLGLGNWTVSLLTRQRAWLSTNADTLELVKAVEGGGTPPGDRDWRVHADYVRFAGTGGELAHRWQWAHGAGTWQLDLAAQALALTRVDTLRLEGQARYAASTEAYTADLAGHRAGNHLTFPFQQPQAARGGALLWHGQWRYETDRWEAGVRWRDAGWLQWQALPQQGLTLSTQLQTLDANGYVVYGPLVQGRNEQPRYRRALAPVTTWQVGWRLPEAGRLQLGADHVPHFGWLPYTTWRRPLWSGRGDVALGWRFHERRAELGLGWQGLRIALAHDLRQGDSHSRAASLSWGGSF